MREYKGNWTDIFHSFMVALDPRKLILAVVAMALSLAATLIPLGAIGHTRYAGMTGSQPTSEQFFDLVSLGHQVVFREDAFVAFLGYVFFGIVLNFVWAKFGGAITRIAAIEVARDERIETQKALEYSSVKYGSYFWPPIACLLFFGAFFLCNTFVGLIARIPVIDFLILLLFPLALLSGFIMTLILIGGVCGGPFFYPVISAEGTETFDAVSRGFSYVYTKPWHYIWYQLVNAVYGVVCIGFVYMFGCVMTRLTLFSGGAGIGFKKMHALYGILLGVAHGGEYNLSALFSYSWTWGLSGIVLSAWLLLTVAFVLAYGISYYLSSQTIIYFLLRKKVDGIEMNEVYDEEEGEDLPWQMPPSTPSPETVPSTPAPEPTGEAKAEASAPPEKPKRGTRPRKTGARKTKGKES